MKPLHNYMTPRQHKLNVKSFAVDEGQMSATCVFSTAAIDRVGDVVEPSGIDTSNHQINPVVLLDHGLSYPLAIGKTEDANGIYTVSLSEEEGVQTTYFSQSDKVAEQCFSLIAEGILRGNSLRYDNGTVKRMRDAKGMPLGRHVVACDLVEISWVALPMNQECVTTLLDRGTLNGKGIHTSIKSLLAPFKLAPKVWANGATLMNKEDIKQVDEEPKDESPQDEKEEDQEPMGAMMLRSLHQELKDIHGAYSDSVGSLEQPKVKKKMEKMLKGIAKQCNDVAELHKGVYPDRDGLEMMDTGDDEPDQDDKDDNEPKDKDEEPKDEKSINAARKMLEELMLKERDLSKYKQLNSINLALRGDHDDTSERERAELARLERSIARKEEMLKRIGLS